MILVRSKFTEQWFTRVEAEVCWRVIEMESDSKKTRRMALILFGLVVDNGNLLKLIDRRKVEVREVPPFEDEVTLYIDDRGNKTEL